MFAWSFQGFSEGHGIYLYHPPSTACSSHKPSVGILMRLTFVVQTQNVTGKASMVFHVKKKKKKSKMSWLVLERSKGSEYMCFINSWSLLDRAFHRWLILPLKNLLFQKLISVCLGSRVFPSELQTWEAASLC